MANYTSTGNSKHVTSMVANTPDTVTLATAAPFIEVVNDGTVPLYFVLYRGATNERITTLSVGGDGCYYVGPGAVRTIHDDGTSQYLTNTPANAVQLISAGTGGYHVTGLQENDLR